MSITTKKCSQCQRDLPHFMFYSKKTAKDGMSSECRDCRKKYNIKSDLKRKIKNKKPPGRFSRFGRQPF